MHISWFCIQFGFRFLYRLVWFGMRKCAALYSIYLFVSYDDVTIGVRPPTRALYCHAG